mgnify:CR=1 FL=1
MRAIITGSLKILTFVGAMVPLVLLAQSHDDHGGHGAHGGGHGDGVNWHAPFPALISES